MSVQLAVLAHGAQLAEGHDVPAQRNTDCDGCMANGRESEHEEPISNAKGDRDVEHTGRRSHVDTLRVSLDLSLDDRAVWLRTRPVFQDDLVEEGV